MKQFIVTVLFFCFSHMTFAQRNIKQVEANIAALHKSVFTIRDPQALRPLLGNDLIYVHTDGHFETRDSLLQRISPARGANYSNFNATTVQLRFPNKHTAIVKQLVTADVNNNGQLSRLNIYLLMVWVKQNSRWVLEMRQALKAG